MSLLYRAPIAIKTSSGLIARLPFSLYPLCRLWQRDDGAPLFTARKPPRLKAAVLLSPTLFSGNTRTETPFRILSAASSMLSTPFSRPRALWECIRPLSLTADDRRRGFFGCRNLSGIYACKTGMSNAPDGSAKYYGVPLECSQRPILYPDSR